MRRIIPVLTAALVVCVPAPAGALTGPALKAKLARVDARMGYASGAYVRDLTTRTVLYSRNANRRLAPASNEKLYTTAAALNQFGAQGTLQTTVQTGPSAQISLAGVLNGDLYLVGGGDPTLDDSGLKKLASQVRYQAHVTRIDGSIVGDESLFDLRRGSYASNYAGDSEVEGTLGALVWDRGVSDSGGPAHAAAARFRHFLSAAGVTVAGDPVTLAHVPSGLPQTLAAIDSPTIAKLIEATNRPSDNFYAEMLLKGLGATFGAAGTTPAGAAVVRAMTAGFGVHNAVVDGSGLSRVNRTTARQVVALLASMNDSIDVDAWTTSLAAPGEGTLAHRMLRTLARGCRMKTGTLSGVSALSGYCPARNGDTIAFSFIENGVCTSCAKGQEDRMVPWIAGYAGSASPSPSPKPTPTTPSTTPTSPTVPSSPTTPAPPPTAGGSAPAARSSSRPASSTT